MSSSNNRLFLLLLVFSLFFSAVRSESDSDFSSSAIRLPTDDNNDTICLRSTAPVSCPVSCFRTNPVCGVDGVTYWCGCTEAMCSGTRVAKLGFCEVGNGGNGLLSGQGLLLVHMVWLIVLGFSPVRILLISLDGRSQPILRFWMEVARRKQFGRGSHEDRFGKDEECYYFFTRVQKPKSLTRPNVQLG